MNRLIIILATLLVLSSVGAFPSAFASQSTPFNGHMSGNSQAISSVSNSLTATVYLEHLGKSSLVGTTTVTGSSECGGFVGTEKDTITAANGDRLFLSGKGVSCPAGTTVFHDNVTFTITGGTGRFAHASGSGITQTTIDLTSQTTATFAATIAGIINY